jgi:hypothetical protein
MVLTGVLLHLDLWTAVHTCAHSGFRFAQLELHGQAAFLLLNAGHTTVA